MGPESDDSLISIESKKYFNIQSSLIRSYLLAFPYQKILRLFIRWIILVLILILKK